MDLARVPLTQGGLLTVSLDEKAVGCAGQPPDPIKLELRLQRERAAFDFPSRHISTGKAIRPPEFYDGYLQNDVIRGEILIDPSWIAVNNEWFLIFVTATPEGAVPAPCYLQATGVTVHFSPTDFSYVNVNP